MILGIVAQQGVRAGGGGGLPTTFGEAFGGGFYAADIQYGSGQWYKLILADVSSEATGTGARWQTSPSLTPGTFVIDDGVANTLLIVDDGVGGYPAAQSCVNHAGGGFDDWYLPAINEIVQIMNTVGPQTDGAPAIFLTGGDQAMAANTGYWSSTQQSATTSLQTKSTPAIGSASRSKNSISFRGRSVRRLPFTP